MRKHSKTYAALILAGLECMVLPSSARAQTYTVMHRFEGSTRDGWSPQGGLVMDGAGNLYGTVVNGPSCSPAPCTASLGMIYELTQAGTETIVHRFTGKPDGANPYAGLIRNSANNAFGTTSAGGASDMGTVFELASSGEKIVHSFTGPPADGAFPYAPLVQDQAGNLYGTTSAGGASNSGTVFEISAAGEETILYSFTGAADGGFPYGGLLRSAAGNLYGTTSSGGTAAGNCFPYGCGVVFEITTAGKEKVLYRFTGSPDGASPYGTLLVDSVGDLYGTTYNGGTGLCTNGCGVVFELDESGVETVLHDFQGSPNDGAFPYAGLVFDTSGNLYGTTAYGGASDNGTVFELQVSGTEIVLYSFMGSTDGGVPHAPLIIGSTGILYGTAFSGGFTGAGCGGSPPDSCGVVFRLKP